MWFVYLDLPQPLKLQLLCVENIDPKCNTGQLLQYPSSSCEDICIYACNSQFPLSKNPSKSHYNPNNRPKL